jgi:hypothetical protein
MAGFVSTLAPVFAPALPFETAGQLLRSGSLQPWAQALAWALPRQFRMMEASLAEGTDGFGGIICGLMTAIWGSGHTLPFMMSDFYVAFVAAGVCSGRGTRFHLPDPSSIHGELRRLGGCAARLRRGSGLLGRRHNRSVVRGRRTFSPERAFLVFAEQRKRQ